jgi:ketosteroid isomerase-like protein
MSEETLDLALRAVRAAAALPPDFETVNALFHPDHVFVPVTSEQLGEAEAKGAAGYKAWLEDSANVMSWEADVRGPVDVGAQKVLVVTVNRFRGATSGLSSEFRAWAVVTVAGGKITRTEVYIDPAKALEAAGPSE